VDYGGWTCTRCKTENEGWRDWCQRCTHARSSQPVAGTPVEAAEAPASGAPRRGVVIGVAIALVAVAAGAFVLTRGDDSKKSVATTSSSAAPATTLPLTETRTPEQIAADLAAAQAIVLQLTDLPGGWSGTGTRATGEETPSELDARNRQAVCLNSSPEELANLFSTAPSAARSDSFVDGQGLQAEGDVAIVANEAIAKRDFNLFKSRKFNDCLAQFANEALNDELASQGELPPEVKIGAPIVTDLRLGNVRADFHAIKMTFPLQYLQVSARVALDLVFALKGRTEITLSFLTEANAPAFSVDLETQITNALVQRAPAT
jgi:hypothetical protein